MCGKILEKIVYDELYTFLVNNNLITKHQLGFRAGDSTITQPLSITTSIFESFEEHDERRAVVLVISNAFDKVWHGGLALKLQCIGISFPLIHFCSSYLSNSRQKVVLNGTKSEWKEIGVGALKDQFLIHYIF